MTAFYNVSGIDRNDGARIVFVWCREMDPANYVLVGSGHLVGAVGCDRPQGVPVGQFSVTFPLSSQFSADDIVVTDDKNSKEYLPNITVTFCSALAGHNFERAVPLPTQFCAGTSIDSPNSPNDGQYKELKPC